MSKLHAIKAEDYLNFFDDEINFNIHVKKNCTARA